MIRFTFFLFSLFSLFNVKGQNITVTGVVYDIYGDPVPDALYYPVDNPTHKKRSDRSGSFTIEFNAKANDTIRFRHVGFESFDLVITNRMLRRVRNQRIEMDVTLPEKEGDVIVVRSNVPDTPVSYTHLTLPTTSRV